MAPRSFAPLRFGGLCALLLPALLLLAACGSSRRAAKGSTEPPRSERPAPAHREFGADAKGDTPSGEALVAEARRWLGTPYRYGGGTRGEGTDCSGLVMEVYREVCSVKLPRSSREQMAYCTRVAENRVELGDLMFFGAPDKGDPSTVNHVGLYIGNGRMIHASSSRGVIESSVTDGYWAPRFLGAGRVGASATAPLIAGSDKPRNEKAKAEMGKAEKGKSEIGKVSDPSDSSDSSDPSTLLDLLIDQKIDSIAQLGIKK